MTDDRIGPSERRRRSYEKIPASGRSAAANRSRRMRQVMLAACLCVAVTGVSVAIASGGSPPRHGFIATSGRTASTAPSGHSSNASVGITTTGQTASGAGTATSSPPWPRRLLDKMLRWKAGPGGTALTAVETEMDTAMQSAGLRLYPAMRLACIRLASDVGTARSAPPIPKPSLQRLYTRALSGLSRAAEQCRTSLAVHAADETIRTRVNRYLLNRSRVQFAVMSRELYRATGEIQALGT